MLALSRLPRRNRLSRRRPSPSRPSCGCSPSPIISTHRRSRNSNAKAGCRSPMTPMMRRNRFPTSCARGPMISSCCPAPCCGRKSPPARCKSSTARDCRMPRACRPPSPPSSPPMIPAARSTHRLYVVRDGPAVSTPTWRPSVWGRRQSPGARFSLPEQARRLADCGIATPDGRDDLFMAAWRFLNANVAKLTALDVKRAGDLLFASKCGCAPSACATMSARWPMARPASASGAPTTRRWRSTRAKQGGRERRHPLRRPQGRRADVARRLGDPLETRRI